LSSGFPPFLRGLKVSFQFSSVNEKAMLALKISLFIVRRLGKKNAFSKTDRFVERI
jgi:hypothetical protein